MGVYFDNPFDGDNDKKVIESLKRRCSYLENELKKYKNNKDTNKTNTYEEWERENKEFLLEFFERYANMSGYFGKNYIEIGLSLDNKKICEKTLFNKSNFVY